MERTSHNTLYIFETLTIPLTNTGGDWSRGKIEIIYDASIHVYVVTVKKGQRYDLVVTATNKYGESLKEQRKIKRINVLGGKVMAFFLFLD